MCVLSSSYFLTRFCIMVINACEICTCCSACFRNSSICSSCCLALDSCSFLCNSNSCVRMESSLSAFSFRNSTASPPLLQVFFFLRRLPQIHDFFSRPCVPLLFSDFFSCLFIVRLFLFFSGKAIFLLT